MTRVTEQRSFLLRQPSLAAAHSYLTARREIVGNLTSRIGGPRRPRQLCPMLRSRTTGTTRAHFPHPPADLRTALQVSHLFPAARLGMCAGVPIHRVSPQPAAAMLTHTLSHADSPPAPAASDARLLVRRRRRWACRPRKASPRFQRRSFRRLYECRGTTAACPTLKRHRSACRRTTSTDALNPWRGMLPGGTTPPDIALDFTDHAVDPIDATEPRIRSPEAPLSRNASTRIVRDETVRRKSKATT